MYVSPEKGKYQLSQTHLIGHGLVGITKVTDNAPT